MGEVAAALAGAGERTRGAAVGASGRCAWETAAAGAREDSRSRVRGGEKNRGEKKKKEKLIRPEHTFWPTCH